MGSFTSYDQNGRMVADFDKSDYDFLCRYGRTPEEVIEENVKLRMLVRGVWCLFIEHGAVNSCDLPAVDAVRDRLRELGIEVTA